MMPRSNLKGNGGMKLVNLETVNLKLEYSSNNGR